MLLFLSFLHLIKYSQINVNMFHYDYIYFPLYFFRFLQIYIFVSLLFKCLVVYDVYLLRKLDFLSLKIFIFVSFFKKNMQQ